MSGQGSGSAAFSPELFRFSDLSPFTLPKSHLVSLLSSRHFIDLIDIMLHSIFQLGQCRSVESIQKLDLIGKGTYGVVYRARDTKNNEILALKRLRIENPKDGFPISSIREINLLRTLKHENIVEFKGIAVGRGLDSVFLIMEFCEQDLATLVDHKIHFTESQVCFTI